MTFPPSGSTTKYAFPYPLETDIPDVATFGQEIAAAVETTVDSVAKISRQSAGSMMVPGVVAGGDLFTSQHTAPNMSVNVSSGGGWVAGTLSVPRQGNYFYYNPSTVNLSIANNVSGNPRLDAVCLTVKDSDFGGSVDTPGLIQVITGTPAGTPVLPTLPANSLLLASVAVASGAGSITSGNIANVAPLASSQLSVKGVPVARLFQNSGMLLIPSGQWVQVISLANDPTITTGFTVGTNQLTIVTTGTYRVTGAVSVYNMTATGDAVLAGIYVNGTLARSTQFSATSSLTATPLVSSTMRLNAGDVLKFYMRQNSGGFNNGGTIGTSADTWFEAELVSI